MRRRPGFTLIELMMAVSIIALLVSLILPAVQSARENARRVHCANNLMQLGIGLGSYASTHSVLPPGVVNETGPIKNLPYGYHHSWVVQILPFIGQGNLYGYVDQRDSVYDPANDTVAEFKIATLMCPSDNTHAAHNYAGCHHDVQAPIAAVNHGVLYLNSHVRYRDITDGTALTILLGEISDSGPTLGWVSGTRSTLRNTGTPPRRPSTASARARRGQTRAPQLSASGRGIWGCGGSRRGRPLARRAHRRLFEQPLSPLQFPLLRRIGASHKKGRQS